MFNVIWSTPTTTCIGRGLDLKKTMIKRVNDMHKKGVEKVGGYADFFVDDAS